MKEFCFLLVFLFLLSCNQNKQEALTLEKSVFKDILKDVHEFEGGFDSSLFIDSTISEDHLLLYDSLFATKNITKEDFLDEYNRYLDFYLVDLDSIYTDLIGEFTRIRDSIEDELNDEDRDRVYLDDDEVEERLEQKNQIQPTPKIRDIRTIQRLPQTKDSGKQ